MLRWIGRIWASPWTIIALCGSSLSLVTGTKMKVVRGAIECHGGLVTWFLKKFARGAAGMTLGHVILGQSEPLLEIVRDHEHVHVRQYERWGLFFIPAYAISSIYVALTGGNPYFDNYFEKEAYALHDPRKPQPPQSESDTQPS